jgi:hypothetical protein
MSICFWLWHRVAWFVLVLEIFFEILIRPSNYSEVMFSEKAYAPSTARHINRFHFFFEVCALLLFIPSSFCAFTHWNNNIWFDRTEATLQAVKGVNRWMGALSRISLGLTFLRCFGLLRHWKQMWIMYTYEVTDPESCK